MCDDVCCRRIGEVLSDVSWCSSQVVSVISGAKGCEVPSTFVTKVLFHTGPEVRQPGGVWLLQMLPKLMGARPLDWQAAIPCSQQGVKSAAKETSLCTERHVGSVGIKIEGMRLPEWRASFCRGQS